MPATRTEKAPVVAEVVLMDLQGVVNWQMQQIAAVPRFATPD